MTRCLRTIEKTGVILGKAKDLLSSNERRRAVFLDRDGVLNRNVFYADTQAFESPRDPEAVALTPGAGDALRALRQAGWLLILVSNQPNAAKGKCSMHCLEQVHARLIDLLAAQGATLDAEYYCLHHPDHSGPCACRKPSPFFLVEAARKFNLDLAACWMIGDRASDIACGRAAGSRTVWIDTGESAACEETNAADLVAGGVKEAVEQLLLFTPGNKG